MRKYITAKQSDLDRIEKWLQILTWIVVFGLIILRLSFAENKGYLFPLEEPVYVHGKIFCTSWYSKWRTENGKSYQYKALNYPSKLGTNILASGDGVVIDTLIHGYEGGTITIQYDDGLTIRVCHISKQLVLDGQRVKRGQVIAKVGCSGRATGPHVRIVVEKNGERVFCNAETWGKKYGDFYYSPGEFDSNKTKLYANINAK